MFIVKLIENESEAYGEVRNTSKFHVPINMIEFKLETASLNEAFLKAQSRLNKIMNATDEVEFNRNPDNSLVFWFGNKSDGLGVTYKIEPVEEQRLRKRFLN